MSALDVQGLEAANEEYVSCNGQIIYRQKCYGIDPDRRCEVFVGRVPRDSRLKEDLVPIFKQVGRLLEFRLLVSFSGHCRGFGFAIYANREEAEQAIKRFNNFEIRKKWYLGVCWSQNKCKISLSHLPTSKSFQEIADFVYTIANTCGPGDEPVYIVYCRNFGSRGCTVIWEHKTHRAAALNRKNITGPAASIFGPQTQVTWVDAGLRIDVDTFPFMATRKDKNSPVIISRTDLSIVNMFETEEVKLPLRQIRKGDSRCENYSSTFDVRNAGKTNRQLRHSAEDSLDFNVEWNKLPESLTSLFNNQTPVGLMQRRNANVPSIQIGDPAEPSIELNVSWKNLPALASLMASENKSANSPKAYSPARTLSSAEMKTPVSTTTVYSKFRFDNVAVAKNSNDLGNSVAPVTPPSSGYGSQDESPLPMFTGLRNPNVNIMTNDGTGNTNIYTPSFFNRQIAEYQSTSGSPLYNDIPTTSKRTTFDMSYFNTKPDNEHINNFIWERGNSSNTPSVDRNTLQTPMTPVTSANTGTSLQEGDVNGSVRDGGYRDWTGTPSLWETKKFF